MTTTESIKHPEIKVELVGSDGNAFAIELDYAVELVQDSLEILIQHATRWVTHDLSIHTFVNVEVVTMTGSGGGWPVVRFTGRREDIARIQDAYDVQAGA